MVKQGGTYVSVYVWPGPTFEMGITYAQEKEKMFLFLVLMHVLIS